MQRPGIIATCIVAFCTTALASMLMLQWARSEESHDLDRYFADSAAFAPLPKPGPNDWLVSHPEKGQTFAEWNSEPHNLIDERRVIYIQPLDDVGRDKEFLDNIRRFTAAFFGVEARLLPPLALDHQRLRHRDNSFTKTYQLHTADLLSVLRPRLPRDGYCLIGVTLTDIYPADEWNFVFGVAELKNRIGVYSFARFDPARDPFNRTDLRQRDRTILERSCRILAHEIGHMFGIRHCTAYLCLMNGSNHLDESDARPLHYCPVDLRKLHAAVKFDLPSHHRELARVLKELGFVEDAQWYERRP